MSIILTIGLPSNQNFLNKQKEDICVDDELYCKQETAPLQSEKHKSGFIALHCIMFIYLSSSRYNNFRTFIMYSMTLFTTLYSHYPSKPNGFPPLINWISPFPFKGLPSDIFQFYSNYIL